MTSAGCPLARRARVVIISLNALHLLNVLVAYLYGFYCVSWGILNQVYFVMCSYHKLTRLLRESLGGATCNTCAIIHLSPALAAYSDTLQVMQLASRMHQTRLRRRSKVRNVRHYNLIGWPLFCFQATFQSPSCHQPPVFCNLGQKPPRSKPPFQKSVYGLVQCSVKK